GETIGTSVRAHGDSKSQDRAARAGSRRLDGVLLPSECAADPQVAWLAPASQSSADLTALRTSPPTTSQAVLLSHKLQPLFRRRDVLGVAADPGCRRSFSQAACAGVSAGVNGFA